MRLGKGRDSMISWLHSPGISTEASGVGEIDVKAACPPAEPLQLFMGTGERQFSLLGLPE